jgi:hypothetical protein
MNNSVLDWPMWESTVISVQVYPYCSNTLSWRCWLLFTRIWHMFLHDSSLLKVMKNPNIHILVAFVHIVLFNIWRSCILFASSCGERQSLYQQIQISHLSTYEFFMPLKIHLFSDICSATYIPLYWLHLGIFSEISALCLITVPSQSFSMDKFDYVS